MKKIRILVRDQNELRRRVVKTGLTSVADVELDYDAEDILDVLMALKNKQADVIVASTSDEDRGVASHVLAQFPDTTMLVLGPAGEANIEQRCRHRWTSKGQTGEEIADAIRQALDNPCDFDSVMVS